MYIKFSVTYFFHYTEVTVGFERTFTSVNESTGSFELCIRIFTDVTLLNISFIFNLDLISVPITAGNTPQYYYYCCAPS